MFSVVENPPGLGSSVVLVAVILAAVYGYPPSPASSPQQCRLGVLPPIHVPVCFGCGFGASLHASHSFRSLSGSAGVVTVSHAGKSPTSPQVKFWLIRWSFFGVLSLQI